MNIEVAEPSRVELPRRRIIGVAAGSAALAVLAGGTLVGATPEDDGPTTTVPPRRPNDDDVALLSLAQTLEFGTARLYNALLADGQLSDDERPVVAQIAEHHEAYGQAISALLGRLAPNDLDAEIDGFDTDSFDLVAARQLESKLVATHEGLIGTLQGIDGATLIASIMIVEARHGTALAHLAGESEIDALLLARDEAAFDAEAGA